MNNPELQKIVDSLDLSEIEATYSRESHGSGVIKLS